MESFSQDKTKFKTLEFSIVSNNVLIHIYNNNNNNNNKGKMKNYTLPSKLWECILSPLNS